MARDCAMRGLSVLLLEKQDLASGASGASSGMIHGGIRYMTSDRRVTELASRDAGYIRRIAPHLTFRIPFLIPFATHREEATLLDRLTWYATEVYVGTYDLFQPLKGGKPSARLTAEELYAVEPSLRPGLHGAVTLDEWGIDGQRLCLLNALSAAAHGAEVRTWTEATGLVREAGRVVGVRWRDALTGEHGEARAGVVVNATGGWSPRWGKSNGVAVPMRPGKGVHLSLDRRHGNYGIICTAVDGRQMFLMPHEMESIIGTTDDDYYDDPDDLDATAEEVEYLVEGVASLVPSVRAVAHHPGLVGSAHHASSSTASRRTTCPATTGSSTTPPREPRGSSPSSGASSRATGPSRRRSPTAPWRSSGRRSCPAAPTRSRCPAATRCRCRGSWPSGTASPRPSPRGSSTGTGRWRASVLRLVDDDPRMKLVVCRDEGIIAAEVAWIARHEKVRRLQDLRRRCRLAVGGCGGLDCARPAAQIAARELGWSADQIRAELADLLEVGWRERRPVLDGWQLAEEELLRAVHRGLGGL